MLKNTAIACAVLSLLIAASGYIFISRYDISGSSTSVIEASLMQVAHLRYVVASIFGLASAVLLSAHRLVIATQNGHKQQAS